MADLRDSFGRLKAHVYKLLFTSERKDVKLVMSEIYTIPHICPVCALSIWTSAAKDAHTHDPSETTQGEGQDECDSDQDFELDGDVYLMEVAGQLDPETSHDSASEGEWESDEDTGEYSEAESAVEDGSRGDDDEDQSGSVEGHGRSNSAQDHYALATAKRILEKAYRGTKVESRVAAELAYPWFISIFSQLHDFGLFYDLEGRTDNAPGYLQVREANKKQTLHEAILTLYELDGDQYAGVEMMLAISFDLNPKIGTIVEKHLDHEENGHLPLPIHHLGDVALENARVSCSSGVYCLRSELGKWVVGSTMRTFKARLDKTMYADCGKTPDEFSPDDHRIGRTDRILYDADALLKHGPHVAWIVYAIEAFAIVMFGTTLTDGLNSNVVDRRNVHGGRTPKQIHDIWQMTQDLGARGVQLPNNVESDSFKSWFDEHIRPTCPEETPSGYYKLIRKIAGELVAGDIRYFQPLPESIWTGPVPKVRKRGTAVYKIRGSRKAWREARQLEGYQIAEDVTDRTGFQGLPLLDIDMDSLFSDNIVHHPDFESETDWMQTRTMKGSRLRAKLSTYEPETDRPSS